MHTHACMLTHTHTHRHEKWGLGCPDKLPTSPALQCLSMGETRWPSRRWVDKWKVRELSGEGTLGPHFLYVRQRRSRSTWGQEVCFYFKSLYPVYHHKLCSLAREALRLSTEYVRGEHIYVCGHACVEQRRPAFQTGGRGLGVWNARHSLTPV